MAGLAGFGHFAGGLTRGYLTMQDELRRKEDQEERRLERERRKKREEAAGETLGRVGQSVWNPAADVEGDDMPASRTYTREDALRDYGSRIAGVDPEASMRAMGLADDFKLRGLQIRGAERGEETARTQQQILTLRRRLASGENPMIIFRELQGLNKRMGTGTGTKVFELNGHPHALIYSEDGDDGQPYPITAENVEKALQQAYSFTSPQAMQQERQFGLEGRKVSATERTAAATERNAQNNAEYRQGALVNERERNRIIDEHYRRSDARLGSASAQGRFQLVGQDSDGVPIVFNSRDGQLTRQDGQPIKDQQFFNRVTGIRQGKEKPAVHPKLVEGLIEELKNVPQMTPEIETHLRKKYGAAYDEVFGPDPIVPAADSVFGGGRRQGGGLPTPGRAEPQATGLQDDPVVLDLQRQIRIAAQQGNVELVHQLNAGLQKYIELSRVPR